MTKFNPKHATQLILGGAMLAALASSVLAQEAKLEIEQKPLPPLPNSIDGSEPIENRIKAFLKSQKLNLGENKDNGRTILVFQGLGAISVPPSDKNFVALRKVAFDKAMLDAKEQCAKFQETRISSEMSIDMASPGAERAAADAQRLQREGLANEGAVQVAKALNTDIKAKNAPASIQTGALYGEKILENQMREELTKKGIDPDKPVSDQQVKAVMSTSSFKNASRSTARARCTGIQAFASFEQNPASGQGSVGVVAIWSRKLHEVADAIITGNYALIPKNEPGLPIAQHIPDDLRVKLSTYGTQLVRDENGEYVLLAFAQAQPLSKSQQSITIAKSVARQVGEGMIRQFLGEAIASTNDLLQKEKSTEFEDESNQTKYEERFSKQVQAVAQKLSVPGIMEADSWQTLHPANNGPVVGVVLQWKASSAQLAGQLKAFNQASGAKTTDAANRMSSTSSGSTATAPSSSAPAAPRPRTSNANSGQGAVSRDF